MEKREGVNTIMGAFYQGRSGETFEVLKRWKPAVVKVMHTKQSEIDTIRRNSPASVIWARIYEDDSKVSDDIQRDPEGAAEYHHGLIVAKGWTDVDLYQIQNETNQNPVEMLKLLTRYYVRLINLAQQAGYKVTVGDFSVGNLHVGKDHPGDWEYFFPALELAQKYNMPVNVHQYSKYSFWDDRYPTDWYIHRLEQTAMKVLDAAGFNKIEYVIGEHGMTNLLSNKIDPSDGEPGGWQKWRTHEEYRQDLINIFSYLLQFSDRIIGYACYLTHPFHPWETHEMSRMNEDLASHYAANPQAVKVLGSGEEVRPILFQARVINTSTLNVRSGPGTEHGVLGQVTDKDIIGVYAADALWWEIKHKDLVGWSHSGYLERIEEESTLELRVSALEATDEIHTAAIARLEQVVAELMISIRMLDTRVTALEDGDNGGGGERRFSEGATYMGLTVEPPSGSIRYRLKDIFTTLNGSWEVGDQPKPYAIEQWARDAYLSNDFDDAGADHHLFAHILDRNGNTVGNRLILYDTPDHEGNRTMQQTKSHSGWANIVLSPDASFSPENNERGVWAWGPPGGEIVMGGGLPNRHHVSTFAVWQEV